MANNKKVKKFRGVENPAASQAAAERAFSGAWGTHEDRRTRRARTRGAAVAKAIREH